MVFWGTVTTLVGAALLLLQFDLLPEATYGLIGGPGFLMALGLWVLFGAGRGTAAPFRHDDKTRRS